MDKCELVHKLLKAAEPCTNGFDISSVAYLYNESGSDVYSVNYLCVDSKSLDYIPKPNIDKIKLFKSYLQKYTPVSLKLLTVSYIAIDLKRVCCSLHPDSAIVEKWQVTYSFDFAKLFSVLSIDNGFKDGKHKTKTFDDFDKTCSSGR